MLNIFVCTKNPVPNAGVELLCGFFQAASPPWLLVFSLGASQVLVPTRSPMTPIIFGCPLVSKLKCF